MLQTYTKFNTIVILHHFAFATDGENVFCRQKIQSFKKQQSNKTVLQSNQNITLIIGSQYSAVLHKREDYLLLLHMKGGGM